MPHSFRRLTQLPYALRNSLGRCSQQLLVLGGLLLCLSGACSVLMAAEKPVEMPSIQQIGSQAFQKELQTTVRLTAKHQLALALAVLVVLFAVPLYQFSKVQFQPGASRLRFQWSVAAVIVFLVLLTFLARLPKHEEKLLVNLEAEIAHLVSVALSAPSSVALSSSLVLPMTYHLTTAAVSADAAAGSATTTCRDVSIIRKLAETQAQQHLRFCRAHSGWQAVSK